MNRKLFFIPLACLLLVFATSCKQEKMTEEQIQSRVDQEVEAAKTEMTEMYEAKIDSILQAQEEMKKGMTIAPTSSNKPKSKPKAQPKAQPKSETKPESTKPPATVDGRKNPAVRPGSRDGIKNQPRKDPSKRSGARNN